MRFVRAMRPGFLTGALAPVFVGNMWVRWKTGHVYPLTFFLLAVAMMCFQASVNVLNDYFDHISGADEANTQFIPPFTGGGRVIQNGIMTPREVLVEGLLLLAAGCAIGLYFTWQAGVVILIIGAIGAADIYYYAAPPIKLLYHGLGEVGLGFGLGVLPLAGVEYLLTHQITLPSVVIGAPVGLLIAGILWINEYPDHDSDKQVGKRTLVVRLGREESVWWGGIFFAITALLNMFAVAMGWLPPLALVALVFLIPAARSIYCIAKGPNDPKWWRPAIPPAIVAQVLYWTVLSLMLYLSGPGPHVVVG